MILSLSLDTPSPFAQVSLHSVDIVDRIDDIGEDVWNRCFPDEIEGFLYYKAVEFAGLADFEIHYLRLRKSNRTIALAPFFVSRYRLDTLGDGALLQLLRRLGARWPKLLSIPMVCLGSPVSEIAHLGYAPELDATQRATAFRALLAGLERFARQRHIGLIALKDIADAERTRSESELLRYTRLPGMPCALLPLPYENIEAYYATLSRGMRKEFRRKARSQDALQIERRYQIADVLPELMRLYEQTRAASDLQFERLPPDYFTQVLQQLGPYAVCVLYRCEGSLIGFNLLLHDERCLLDKFIGMDGQRAREHNLYFVSWLYNVQWCIDEGIPLYEAGQASYETKLRMGCRLLANWYYFRHRNPIVNAGLRLLTRWLGLDRFEGAVGAALEGSP